MLARPLARPLVATAPSCPLVFYSTSEQGVPETFYYTSHHRVNGTPVGTGASGRPSRRPVRVPRRRASLARATPHPGCEAPSVARGPAGSHPFWSLADFERGPQRRAGRCQIRPWQTGTPSPPTRTWNGSTSGWGPCPCARRRGNPRSLPALPCCVDAARPCSYAYTAAVDAAGLRTLCFCGH
jgi:hypothetical protein